MRFGNYTIKFSERGKHYMEILGGALCIAVMVFSLSAVSYWLVTAGAGAGDHVQAEQVGYSTLQVTHIYEDGCIDLYNTEKGTYKFYCEDMTFYGE